MTHLNILFFGMSDCEFTNNCVDHLVKLGFDVKTILTKKRGEPFPSDALNWNGDLIISYKCYWKIPTSLLAKARLAAVNFHPSLPEYRGSGGYCWALYDEREHYGVTVHHMSSELDQGEIISVETFPIEQADNLHSLSEKTSIFSVSVVKNFFSDLVALDDNQIMTKLHPETSQGRWKGPVRKISEVNAMKLIDDSLSVSEIDKRIRAFHCLKYPMRKKIGSKIFNLGAIYEL